MAKRENMAKVTATPTTREDSFNLSKSSVKYNPSLGHAFDDKQTTCKCGKTWADQQIDPTLCPLLIDRLQELEDLDRAIKAALVEPRAEIERLKRAGVNLRFENEALRKKIKKLEGADAR